MLRSVDVRECKVRTDKVRQLMGCGMGNRNLGRFLAWVNRWRGVVKLKLQNCKE